MAGPDPPLIAVCDDSDDILELVEGILLSAGFRVVACATGEDLVEVARVRNPALILLDLRLSREDAGSVILALRAELPAAPPILLLTAADRGDPEAVRALEAGAAGFVGKPFSMEGLLDAVRSHMGP